MEKKSSISTWIDSVMANGTKFLGLEMESIHAWDRDDETRHRPETDSVSIICPRKVNIYLHDNWPYAYT